MLVRDAYANADPWARVPLHHWVCLYWGIQVLRATVGMWWRNSRCPAQSNRLAASAVVLEMQCGMQVQAWNKRRLSN